MLGQAKAMQQNWPEVRALFDRIVELDAAARETALAAIADAAVRADVVKLLEGDAATHSGAVRALHQVLPDALALGAEPDDALGTMVGPWEIVSALGEGGMGTVYLATRQMAGFVQQVALKRLHAVARHSSVAVERFAAEQRMLNALTHPNIAHLIDAGFAADGMPYLALEYVDGVSLLKFAAGLDAGARVRLFLSVLAAVEHAHQRLIVHRDLKPSNILVTSTGVVKLLDFGIGKLLTELAPEEFGLTQTGVRLYTPGYAAPEQLRGEAISTAADIFALGVVLYELLADRRPFEVSSLSPIDWERAVLTSDPRPLVAQSSHPNALKLPRAWRTDANAIVGKALRREPVQRYASVGEFSADLRALLDGRAVLARRGTRRYRVSRFIVRHAVAVGLGAAIVLAIIAGAAAALLQAQRADAERNQARLEAEKAREVVAFLTNVFAKADPNQTNGDNPTARDVLDAGVEELKNSEDLDSEVRAQMLVALSSAYSGLQEKQRSLDLARQAAAVTPLSINAQIATQLVLAAALNRSELRVDSFELARAVRELIAAQPTVDQRSLAKAELYIGVALLNLDRRAESAPHLERAYHGYLTHSGEGSADVGDMLYPYMSTLASTGRADQAVDIARRYRDALAQDERASADRLASANNSLGIALINFEREAEAIQPLTNALKLREKIHGVGHLGTASAINNLAQALRRTGRFEEAVTLQEQVLALRRAHAPDEEEPLAGALCNAAVALTTAKQGALALERAQEGIAIFKRRGEGEKFLSLRCQLTHATALAQLEQKPRARVEMDALMPLILARNDAAQIEQAQKLVAELAEK